MIQNKFKLIVGVLVVLLFSCTSGHKKNFSPQKEELAENVIFSKPLQARSKKK